MIVALGACQDADRGRSADGVRVDTLANGAVHVSNPADGLWERSSASPWRLVEVARIGRADGVGPDVFGSIGDASGRYLGVPESPVNAADLQVRLITEDHLYAVVEDELGVQSLLILRIERP